MRERANVREKPTNEERANVWEKSMHRERAKEIEKPTTVERASLDEKPRGRERATTGEKPSAAERANVWEKSMHRERASEAEKPNQEERAIRPENTSNNERATREQPEHERNTNGQGGHMHAGKITSDSAAGRVYRYLHERKGDWQSGWALTVNTATTAISTRISEVRHQLDGERIEVRRDGRGYWYRLVAS